MANLITQLAAAAALTGTELLWVEQAGGAVKATAQAIADLSGGGPTVPVSTAAGTILMGSGAGGWVENNAVEFIDAGTTGQIVIQGQASAALADAPFFAEFTVGDRYLIACSSPDDTDTFGIEWALNAADGSERVNFQWASFTGGPALAFQNTGAGRVWIGGADTLFQDSSMYMLEKAAAFTDFATYGQLWVRSSDNALVYTGEGGTDNVLTGAGGGNVSNTGTPTNNQLAIWTDATTVEGVAGLTFDGTSLVATEFAGIPSASLASKHNLGRNTAGSTTLLQTDDDGYVAYTGPGGHTYTMIDPATSGTTILIVNVGTGTLTLAEDTGNTLSWLTGSAVTTGNRTLAVGASVSLHYDGAGGATTSNARCWGAGLS